MCDTVKTVESIQIKNIIEDEKLYYWGKYLTKDLLIEILLRIS
jgi:hypothetical protein